jgi:addiction module HigA family antidote
MTVSRLPSHPGEILVQEFLAPLGISQTTLANTLGVRLTRVNEIAKGKRSITPQTAWMFAGVFGTSPEFWMNLQVSYDLAKAKPKKLLKKIRSNGAPDDQR